MRQAFIDTLIELAETDKDLYLLTADMGFGLVEQFAARFPKQYINVGVAEQNMIGVATGLALEGKKVFCYSIANFPTMRCLEQIRNDVCYHNLPVCIVSGGAGLWYGALGMTHWALEDIAVMRCLPNMAVVSPYDQNATIQAVRSATQKATPHYIRMTRTSNTDFLASLFATAARPHTDVTVFATGGQMVANAINASNLLRKSNVKARVAATQIVKPLYKGYVREVAQRTKLVITIEEHSKIGGLGSAVAEVLAEMDSHPPLVRMGTEDRYLDTAMSYEELLKYHHLDVDSIVKETMDAIN